MSTCVAEREEATTTFESSVSVAEVDSNVALHAARESAPDRARVLWLIKGLGLGGAEKLLSLAAPYLDRRRFEYEVGYFLPWKDALVDDLQAHQLPVTCFDVRREFSPAGFARLLSYVRRRRIDVIHMHLPVPGVFGRLAGMLAGAPALVYTEHNMWDRLNPATRLLNRVTFGLNDRAIAVSDDVRLSMNVSNHSHVVTIPNGIPCCSIRPNVDERNAVRDELQIPSDHVVVGTVANLTPKKNHELLLQAFAQFHCKVPLSKLVLVGQFAGRDAHLRQIAAELDIADAVLLTGPRSDAVRVMQAFDVFALSSTFEGLPIALLEAMALEKPSVCTAVGGIPDVIRDGAEGFLVPSQNAELLADRLCDLAAEAALRESMGAAARQRVQHEFDIAVMVREVEAVYTEVLQRKGRWTSR